MLKGRCLCGKVRYEINGALGPVVQCHCSMCRRASGSAFATNASVEADAFRIVAGRKSIKTFESSKGGTRAFCRRCGSPVFGLIGEAPQIVRVRLGLLEDADGARPVAESGRNRKRNGTRLARVSSNTTTRHRRITSCRVRVRRSRRNRRTSPWPRKRTDDARQRAGV